MAVRGTPRDAVSVPNRIREVRKAAGLSARALAEALTEAGHPIDHTTLVKVENGTRRLHGKLLSALAGVLSVAPESLLSLPLRDVPVVSAGELADLLMSGESPSGRTVPHAAASPAVVAVEGDWKGDACLYLADLSTDACGSGVDGRWLVSVGGRITVAERASGEWVGPAPGAVLGLVVEIRLPCDPRGGFF